MGDITEGLMYEQIEKRYGFVDQLLAQDKAGRRIHQMLGPDFVYHSHHRPPGMTEDGMERQAIGKS
jgi:hypothetical protein